ncbi:MAG TPA: thiamine pyrophosphate-dependent enzyme [Candidatus Binatia bacterium]|nr:thiamine pyrophosphate-dependent enzyme [Candidatus Binatia bacterium]
MNRGDVVRAVIEFRNDAVMILGPGKSSGFLWEAPLHPATVYNMELTYATSMALGVALGAPKQRVISLEGDGSMFAAAPTLGTVARSAPPNLTVIVLANGIWGTSDGSVPVTIPPAKFPELAISCGWERSRVTLASELAPLREALRKSIAEPGPWFIAAEALPSSEDASVLADGTLRKRSQAPIDLIESIDATRRFLLK